METHSNDPFYRYKLPQLQITVESRNNKTVLGNFEQLCRNIGRQPHVLLKYLQFELGTLAYYCKAERKYVLKGRLEKGRLNQCVNKFILQFVQCQMCSNPETNMRVSGDKRGLRIKCRACGHRRYIKQMEHKLANYVIQTPDGSC